jgi:hypothetical protein
MVTVYSLTNLLTVYASSIKQCPINIIIIIVNLSEKYNLKVIIQSCNKAQKTIKLLTQAGFFLTVDVILYAIKNVLVTCLVTPMYACKSFMKDSKDSHTHTKHVHNSKGRKCL